MSDAAFRTAAYPSLTTAEIRAAIAGGRGTDTMRAELERRIAVDAGDRDQATDGERLHGRVGARVLAENGGASTADRQALELELRLRSPKRANPGKAPAMQFGELDLPLFGAAASPELFQ